MLARGAMSQVCCIMQCMRCKAAAMATASGRRAAPGPELGAAAAPMPRDGKPRKTVNPEKQTPPHAAAAHMPRRNTRAAQ